MGAQNFSFFPKLSQNVVFPLQILHFWLKNFGQEDFLTAQCLAVGAAALLPHLFVTSSTMLLVVCVL